MAVVQWRKQESVAIIEMCNGANKQNLDFVKDMTSCYDDILKDNDIFSIILTSTDEKNFSHGIDVDWLGQKMSKKDFGAIKSFMYGVNSIFKRNLLMPMPVIAAINGHAFGNGAMLACTCDFRFMKKDKGFFCFPEVDINIPFLPGMIEFVRKAIPEHKFNQMILSGRRLGAEELEGSHVIEKASANQKELMKDAVEFAKTFTKQRPIFAELKKRLHKEIINIIDNEDPKFIEPMNLFVQ
jgi:enoyl-CoA hydratase/carnithine racemase